MSCSARTSVVVGSVNGLQVRAASRIVKEAQGLLLGHHVHPWAPGRPTPRASSRFRSLFKVQTLGMRHGAEITVHAEGSDAEAAVEALCRLGSSIRQ
ncbi:HPr family phosphocarrier protein [Streptomyces sp. NPDC059385]|uniref:HPr family phosphocarrier protein n=1 Tax=Streptomyces sp. NPDC059385 TaxID=3346817 RepID=UPI0036C8F215